MTEAAERVYEQLLVVRCQAGDDGAFADLLDRYHARIAYFVRRLLGDAADVDDVLQETWLAAFRGLPGLRSPAAWPVWVYGIARNQARLALRRRRAWRELDEDLPAPEARDHDPDFAPGQAALIHRCLEQLAPPHREVLMLRLLEGMTYEEIAEVVGRPVGTVRSRIFHARAALRRAMEGQS